MAFSKNFTYFFLHIHTVGNGDLEDSARDIVQVGLPAIAIVPGKLKTNPTFL